MHTGSFLSLGGIFWDGEKVSWVFVQIVDFILPVSQKSNLNQGEAEQQRLNKNKNTMSNYGLFDSTFDKPIKKWTKPAAPANPPVSPSRAGSSYMYSDFVGGCDDGSPTKRWTKPKVSASTSSPPERSCEEWVCSPNSSFRARDRPAQIEIEGRKSIKENPFLKNFGGL